MNPSNHRIGQNGRNREHRDVESSTAPFPPQTHRGPTNASRYAAPLQHFTPPHRSSPIPIPVSAHVPSSSRMLYPAAFPFGRDTLENGDRNTRGGDGLAWHAGTRPFSLRASQNNYTHNSSSSGRNSRVSSRSHSGSNSNSNSNSASGHSDPASDIFHFSPDDSAHAFAQREEEYARRNGRVPFMYTPPPMPAIHGENATSARLGERADTARCRACGRVMWARTIAVHMQVCEGGRGNRRGYQSQDGPDGGPVHHVREQHAADAGQSPRARPNGYERTLAPTHQQTPPGRWDAVRDGGAESSAAPPRSSAVNGHVGVHPHVTSQASANLGGQTRQRTRSLAYAYSRAPSPDFGKLPYAYLP